MRELRWVVAAIAALLLFLLPATAAAKVRQEPPGLAFYTPPRTLPGHGHGGLIWARPLTDAAALAGARNELVLYRSRGVEGKPVAVSGTVSIPAGRPPKGGWPVIAWDHGTSGIADVCAPSRDSPTNPAHQLNSYIYPLLDSWLKAGFAVVRTDYEGLGTPGVHPYLIGSSEARSTLDIVRAARQLYPALSRNVIIAGHSQGGQAALFAAALAPMWTPELRVRGTVAFAPASHLSEQAPLTAAITTPGGGLSAIVALIVRGVDAADPGANIGADLSAPAAALYPETLTECIDALGAPSSFGGLAPAALLAPRLDVVGVERLLARFDDPETLTIHTPVLIEQGLADTTVFPQFTTQLDTAYEQHGVPVIYHTYTGVSHEGIVTIAAADATAWLSARFAGRQPAAILGPAGVGQAGRAPPS
jgi:pimeloyl-ACP methyl ester carboxylesterase